MEGIECEQKDLVLDSVLNWEPMKVIYKICVMWSEILVLVSQVRRRTLSLRSREGLD